MSPAVCDFLFFSKGTETSLEFAQGQCKFTEIELKMFIFLQFLN